MVSSVSGSAQLADRKEFFQREAAGSDGAGVFDPHIPPVPGLEHHAGGGLAVLRPAEDEAIVGGVGRQPAESVGVGKAGVQGVVPFGQDEGGQAGDPLVAAGRGTMEAARASA